MSLSLKIARLFGALALAGLTLSACAVKPVPQDQLAGIKTIGIVCAIDEHVTRKTVALVVFGNETSHGDVSAWHLNAAVAESLQKSFAGRYQTTILDADTTPGHGATDLVDGPLLSFSGPKGLTDQDRVRSALKPGLPPVDAFLVITGDDRNGFAETNQTVSGLSIWSHMAAPLAVTPLRLSLLDGKTLATIATYSAQGDDDRFGVPIEKLPDSLKHDTWEAYSAAERAQLGTVFLRLTTASIDKTVRQMGLLKN